MTGMADLRLDEDESKRLSKSFLDMKRHYGGADVVSPKTADTLRFCMVAGTIYGSRIMALRQDRLAASKARAVAPAHAAAPSKAQNGPASVAVSDDGFLNVMQQEPFA